ncbi:MAG: recombinase family protein [Lachnospiraceae bacterium]|nr:recombinase family protein [Lachnospiraceae bacterium]
MTRTKDRGYRQTSYASDIGRRWRLGIYIRLSREDANKGPTGSNSVKNQRDLLVGYYRRHMDEFESMAEYADDGHTGTDARREGFQRLLTDVMNGRITCVMVKDLSRFSRNYSDAGALIDNLFVQMNIRFISLAEQVDSYRNPDSISDISIPITHVMNDNYCYQTSRKIRQVFDYKRKNGEYIGSLAPYGYIKDPQDKHRLLVDEEAAGTVRQVYSLFLQGSSKRAIALWLNEHGVPGPTAYRRQKGLPVSSASEEDPLWGPRMIHTILTNPVYTGDLVQGRRRVKSYKVHQIENVPKEEWIRVSHTHEAIVPHEIFDQVQALLTRDTRTSPGGRRVHLFSGLLRCADCKRAVTRSRSGKHVYYACSTYKNRSRSACTMHAIRHDCLEAAVLSAIRHQIGTTVSCARMLSQIDRVSPEKPLSHCLDSLIAARERELARIVRYKRFLYQDWKDGEITREEYRDMKADYEKQAASLTDILARLNAERTERSDAIVPEDPLLSAMKETQNIDHLTRDLLVELVDHITICENGDIAISFHFAGPFPSVSSPTGTEHEGQAAAP